MKRFAVIATVIALSSGPAIAAGNPFAARSTLPFEAPPFDKITDADYQPAFEQGMAEQIAEIRAIADNPSPATFDNTIVAMERSGAMLRRVSAAFGAVNQQINGYSRQRGKSGRHPGVYASPMTTILQTLGVVPAGLES